MRTEPEARRSVVRRVPRVALLAVTLLAASSGFVYAQVGAHEGTDFWLAFPDNFGNQIDGAELYIQSNDNRAPNVVSIVSSDGLVNSQTSVKPGTPAILPLPAGLEIEGDGVTALQVEGKGIHVTSTFPVTVKFRSPEVPDGGDDAYLALPTGSLGTHYFALGFPHNVTSAIGDTFSQFAVIATQAGTNVTLRPTCDLSGPLTGVELNQTLDQGEVLQYQCLGSGDVTGTDIISDKPVAVLAGNACAEVPSGTAFCDYLVEQMTPVVSWGTNFVIPGFDNGSDDLVRVLASEDNTQITFVEVIAIDFPLGRWILSGQSETRNRGEFSVFDIRPPSGTGAAALSVRSDKPVLVAQYALGAEVSSTGDPLQVIVPPTEQFRTTYRVFSPPGYTNFLNIIAPSGAEVSVDGVKVGPLDEAPAASPCEGACSLFFGEAPFVAGPVGVASGQHVVSADQPIGVSVTGFRGNGSYGYPAGFGAVATDLAIMKSASPDPVDAGGTVTYTLTVTNNGSIDATSVEVTDALPAGVSNASGSGTGWSCSGTSVITCSRASVPVGDAPVITISATAPADPANTNLSNSASVSSATPDLNESNNSFQITSGVTPIADLSIEKTAPAAGSAGVPLTYTVRAASAGPSTARNLVVTDDLPAGMTNVSATGAGWSCTVAGGVVTCARPTLTPGTAAPDITITATPLGAGALTNTASISSDTLDRATGNNSDSEVTNVVANNPPFFDVISTQNANEDNAGQSRLVITGVTPGAGEGSTQTVVLGAVSSNTNIVPNPTITGTGATRTLAYQQNPGTRGTVTITVTANDQQGQPNSLFQRSFTLSSISLDPRVLKEGRNFDTFELIGQQPGHAPTAFPTTAVKDLMLIPGAYEWRAPAGGGGAIALPFNVNGECDLRLQ